MRKNAPLLLIGALILILMMGTACAPRATQPPQSELVQESIPAEEEVIVEEEALKDVGEIDEGQASEEQPVVNESGVRSDVPIIDGAYRVQIARGGTSISFQVDGSMEDVISYYQNELEKHGWQTTGAGDTYIGARATIIREKEDARMSINFQYNNVGDFVVVNIYFVDR